MATVTSDNSSPGIFFKNLPPRFLLRGDAIEARLLPEYGAVLLARGGAVPPDSIVFENHDEVNFFQERVGWATAHLGGHTIELQKPAMEALLRASEIAISQGLSISPRGADSARRSYRDTELLWESRVEPGLEHWVNEGRLTVETADEIRAMSPLEQIRVIFELESLGMWFAKGLSKSIIYSVAPPGTSQHLSMLAFDVAEYRDETVRRILAETGWFQTVISDLPHFTFLGVDETELPLLGLKKVGESGQVFWVPNI